MSDTKRRTKAELYKLESKMRGQSVSESSVIRSMAGYEKELALDSAKELAELLKMEKTMAGIYKPVRDLISMDKKAEANANAMKRSTNRKSKSILMPVTPEETARFYLGSMGGKAVPPYNYARNWFWEKGQKSYFPSPTVDANRKKGTMHLELFPQRSGVDTFYSVKARNAIGMYFHPEVETGLLNVNSTVSYNAFWKSTCCAYTAIVEGWIGLKIDRYRVSSKKYVDTLLSQKKYIFKDNSFWYGTGKQNEENTGFHLSAQVEVDSSYYYIIWVRCGCRTFQDNSSAFWSKAEAELKVKVPSISWELF